MPVKHSPFSTNGFETTLDSVNLQILDAMIERPRSTVAELARKIGMSAPAVAERIQRLHELGVIAGYRLEIDPRAVGLPMAAFVRIRPGPGMHARVADLARRNPHVAECHRITGEDCFLMKVHVAGVEHLEAVLDEFLTCSQTTTSIVQSTPVPLRGVPLPAVDTFPRPRNGS
ncbi:MAG TPA: Lrp/AsnC family transcriptional regulator [Chloroflexota bacterium]|jgi:Lrp/AsnC family leucine-responsive transcriptional regulator